jgi:hypothetical protein
MKKTYSKEALMKALSHGDLEKTTNLVIGCRISKACFRF